MNTEGLRKPAISSRVEGLVHKIPPVLMLAPGIPEDTRQREWVLAYPGIEAAHKVIVHEQLADDTKDKEDKGIRSERPA